MANAIGGKNTIVLGKLPKNFTNPPPHLTFHLTQAGADEDAARTGDLDITRGHLEINGLPLGDTTIDATGLGDRVFQVDAKASLTLENVTLQGGTAYGGAIYNSGSVALLNCIITNNAAGDGNDGGGIYNAGIFSALNCDFVGNRGGNGAASAFGGNGGGLRNDGNCFLTNCLVAENQSGASAGPDANGGGILNAGQLVLNHCFISGNLCGAGHNGGGPIGTIIHVGAPGTPGASGGSGAGIYNVGEVQLDFSTVYGNVTGNGGNGGPGASAGNGGDGAGIFNAGRCTLNTCTVSSNLCGLGGNGGDGNLMLNGAVGGAGGIGGGICNVGALDVTSGTIVYNQTGAGGNGGSNSKSLTDVAAAGGNGGDGGGIYNDAGNTNAVVVRNTLIALNEVNIGGAGGTNISSVVELGQSPSESVGDAGISGLGFDVAGDFTSDGFNLIGQADDSTGFTNGIAADQTGTDAAPLDPLISPALLLYAFNGGRPAPFLCYPLFGGSPAVDHGNSFGITVDIGGSSRPYDFPIVPNAVGGDGSDIGSYEAHILVPFPIIIPPTPLQPQPTNQLPPLPPN